MSGTKKDRVDNSHDETENQIKKPVATKKYFLQTTTQRDNNSAEIKQENKSSVHIDDKQLVNKSIEHDRNLPQIIINETNNENSGDSLIKINPSESIDNKPPLNQSAQTVVEKKSELDLIQVSEKKEGRKKIRRKDLTKKEINEICGDKDGKSTYTKTKTPGLDPRFQQQNQTMRCFVMYTDFYRCENILGEGELACQWFKDVFTSICPLDWVRRWDEAREEGRLGWTKGRTQGKFPGNRYGV